MHAPPKAASLRDGGIADKDPDPYREATHSPSNLTGSFKARSLSRRYGEKVADTGQWELTQGSERPSGAGG